MIFRVRKGETVFAQKKDVLGRVLGVILSAGAFFLTSCQADTNSEIKNVVLNSEKISSQDTPEAANRQDMNYKIYRDFLQKIYDTMDEKYYKPVSKEIYDKFVHKFDTKLYGELQKDNPSINYIKWRSAAYLVDELKDPDDIFSALIPPKYAEKYEKKVLGKRVDLGIEGKLLGGGYMVTKIEPRSDAYIQGLRQRDLIAAIDGKLVPLLSDEKIQELLNPLENAKVTLDYFAFETREKKTIQVVSQEYFKQSVFLVPVTTPGVFCLQIQTFNRKTSEDMLLYLSWIEKQEDNKGLILDLRGNPGGPPLAAREISSFFLTPGEDFAYFEGKHQPKTVLDVPKIPEQYHYKSPIIILVDNESGSASELFSGIMQSRQRATLMGTNSAGKVLLKSMFDLEDQSMLLLVTAAGHYPDGRTFSFKGLVPDQMVEDKSVDLVKKAALYLSEQKKTQ